MEKTLRATIREITRKHLTENNGLAIGQCLSAVGWVNGTVPDCKNIIELPMTDVAGAGIAAGTALVGRRPIFIIRFQDFLLLNSSVLVNYAAKAKDIFGLGVPIFIRALATEKNGTGPVHSGVIHSIFMHMPGFRVCSPMTPGEYEEIWKVFIENEDPMLVSEHRASFNQIEEIEDKVVSDADITLYCISTARFSALEAIKLLEKEGIKCNFINIIWLKPLGLTTAKIKPIIDSKIGLVIDPDFEIAGASQSIAYEIMKRAGCHVEAFGAKDRSVGTAERYENTTPKPEEITEKVKELVQKKRLRLLKDNSM